MVNMFNMLCKGLGPDPLGEPYVELPCRKDHYKGKQADIFIVQLKRARIPVDVIVTFYCTCIEPVLEYCFPLFHHGLPKYLSDDIEGV